MVKSASLILKIVLGLIVLFSIISITHNKFDYLKSKDYYSQPITMAEREQQLLCLAKNIYFEAATEPFEGKVAVAQVTLNRADNPKFPKDVCKVVTQKNVIMEKVVCQFSWYCDGKPITKPNDKAYEESYAVAKKVLLEGFRLDSLNEALYYHAVYVKPQWPHQKITQIGNHIFYKERF